MKQHLTVQEVAASLSCSEQTVRGMIRSGRLPAIRLGRTFRIREDQVAASLSHDKASVSRHKKA